jgi:hypothetical protein
MQSDRLQQLLKRLTHIGIIIDDEYGWQPCVLIVLLSPNYREIESDQMKADYVIRA